MIVPPFHPIVRNPDLLTILGNFWSRPEDPQRFPVRERLFDTEPEVQVLVQSQQPVGTPKAELLMVHGLEGSSRAGYLRSLAWDALQAGFAAHRLNIRSCGGTEHLSPTLYHSGLTADVRIVAERLRSETGRPVFLAGFSLGGNIVLKLAGELGESGRDLLAGVCAVSTPVDLLACVRRIGERRNVLYERRFVRSLKKRIRYRHSLSPDRFPVDALPGIRTVFDFDDRVTAPHFGFRDAVDYYTTQSSIRFVQRIAMPVLMIQAEDDPMIPFRVYQDSAITSNPWIRRIDTEHGGHIGFISRERPRFWLDPVVIGWMSEILAGGKPLVGTTGVPDSSL